MKRGFGPKVKGLGISSSGEIGETKKGVEESSEERRRRRSTNLGQGGVGGEDQSSSLTREIQVESRSDRLNRCLNSGNESQESPDAPWGESDNTYLRSVNSLTKRLSKKRIFEKSSISQKEIRQRHHSSYTVINKATSFSSTDSARGKKSSESCELRGQAVLKGMR